MTLDELNEHLALLGDLKKAREVRESFLAKAEPGAAVYGTVTRGSGAGDRLGALAAEIADVDEQIETLEWAVRQSENRILDYLKTIRDAQARLIIRLRFLRGYSWGGVAKIMGGKNTRDSVRMICKRYLRQG